MSDAVALIVVPAPPTSTLFVQGRTGDPGTPGAPGEVTTAAMNAAILAEQVTEGRATVRTTATIANLAAVTLAALGGGYAPVAGDTVLHNGSASPDGVIVASTAYAGLYVVGAATLGVAALTRSPLYATAAQIAGATWYVEKGTSAGLSYGLALKPSDITVDTTLLSITAIGGGGSGDLKADGTVPLTAPWNVDGHDITGLKGLAFSADVGTLNGIAVATPSAPGAAGLPLVIGSGDGAPANASVAAGGGGFGEFIAGHGGDGSSAHLAGAGADLELRAGSAGKNNGGGGGSGGSWYGLGGNATGVFAGGNAVMDAGSALDPASNGSVVIGGTNATQALIGRAGATLVQLQADSIALVVDTDTVTGADLVELTDGSVTALHSHSGGSVSLPATEIGYGTGTSIDSSPQLTYNDATSLLKISDDANASLLETNGAATDRTVTVKDAAGVPVWRVTSGSNTGRTLREFASDGALFRFVTGRSQYLYDDNENFMQRARSNVASRDIVYADDNERPVLTLRLVSTSDKSVTLGNPLGTNGGGATPSLKYDAVGHTLVAYSALLAAKWSLDLVTGTVTFPGVGSDVRGDLLYRGASNYQRLAAGTTAGAPLLSGGSASDPAWGTTALASYALTSAVTAAIASPATTVTTPGAYPYTTLAGDSHVRVDTASARSILLVDGSTNIVQLIEDGGDLSGTNNITVSLANTAKKLNGTTNGTLVIATNGAVRSFSRDTSGNWRGGV